MRGPVATRSLFVHDPTWVRRLSRAWERKVGSLESLFGPRGLGRQETTLMGDGLQAREDTDLHPDAVQPTPQELHREARGRRGSDPFFSSPAETSGSGAEDKPD